MPLWLRITIPILAVVGFFVAKVPFDSRLAWVSAVAIVGFAAPSFLALWRDWPKGRVVTVLAVLSVFAIGIEALSITTGFPYSRFVYSETIGGRLFGLVPWTVPFAWIPLVLGASARFGAIRPKFRVACVAAHLVAIDLLLDPGAVRLGFWMYQNGSFYYDVPLQNFLGWVLSGGLAAGVLLQSSQDRPVPAAAVDSLMLIVAFWTSVCAFAGLVIPAFVGALLVADLIWFRLGRTLGAGRRRGAKYMENRWHDEEARGFSGPLAQRVYTSRLLGRDPSLVLHGGGNTSVKHTATDLMGRVHDVLYVKGSGSDLATIEEKHFSPVRMEPLLELATLETLSDPAMARELRRALMDPAAPDPSVEAILHALLPFPFVDHTHADAVVSLTNTPSGEHWIREVYGDSVVVIPYVMPGFRLSRLCAEIFPRQAHAGTVGMVLLNHGIFSFGATAKESYDRMIALVAQAEEFLRSRGAWNIPLDPAALPISERVGLSVAQRRKAISDAAGFPVLLALHDSDRTRAFARHADVGHLSQQGPATPDHVIRTKRVPLLGSDIDRYVADYGRYYRENSPKVDAELTMLDPAPRVVLDREWGLATVGRSAKEAAIPRDIYAQTVDIILRSEALEGWKALPPFDIFEVEYWDLEQAKLRKQGARPVFAGEVALVTGAASGIGAACVAAFRGLGAAVVALDIAESVETAFTGADVLGIRCDVTDPNQVADAVERAVRAFGGVDMAVLNAGILLPSAPIASMDLDAWRRTQQVNVEGNVVLMQALHPLLKLAPRRGRAVIVASKNVPAPGPGMAAYSSSKAALTQLGRVAALEWAPDGIRVNTLHPNAVFDTGIWTEEVLAKRAAAYGLSVAEYKTNNLLRVEVTSKSVADLACTLCSPVFGCTTGAQVPVDGGNDRVV